MSVSDPAFNNYFMLINKIDAFCTVLSEKLGKHLQCRKGCDSCCKNISVFPVEAEIVKLSLLALPSHIIKNLDDSFTQSNYSCPLLLNGSCSIYDNRPVICRTHGYPIVFDADGKSKIDYCSMNFKGLDSINGRFLLNVDNLNMMLAAVNADFVATTGIKESGRVLLSDLLRISSS